MNSTTRILLYTTLAINTAYGADFASSYNLADHGLVTPVKNQGELGDCWAFASTTAFESNLLVKGIWTNPNDTSIRLSQWHLATRSGTEPVLTPTDNAYTGWGGTLNRSIAYWARGPGNWPSPDTSATIPNIGGGPVLVSNNSLNRYPFEAVDSHENLAPYIPPANQPTAYLLRNANIINLENTSSTAPDYTFAEQRNRIKSAITTYGGLYTSFNVENGQFSSATIDGETYEKAHYIYNGTDYEADHAVTIVGWDDDVSIDGASSPGAWLIQNSWGTDVEYNGYLYVSYEDTYLGKSANMAVDADVLTGYSATPLQNQYFYPESYVDELPELQAASRLTADTDGQLRAVGVTTWVDGQEVKISVYEDWNESAGAPENEVAELSVTATPEYQGYHLIDLPLFFAYSADDEFVIVVEYDATNTDDLLYDSESTSTEGLSYFYDGTEWVDFAGLAEAPGTFFVKGYSVPEPEHFALFAGIALMSLLVYRRRRGAQ